jgi:hypothetical protein
MAGEIDTALAEIASARNYAAQPLTFTTDASDLLEERGRGQLEATLPDIAGGWETVRDAILSAAGLVGEVAKAVALFQDANATEINVEQAALARTVAERACRLKLAADLQKDPEDLDVSDGWVCG